MISGDVLRILREAKGWNQQTLAQQTGIDPSVVSRLERGLQSDLKVSVLFKLAQALEVSLDVLVSNQSKHTNDFVGELAAIMPQLQQLSQEHQRQVAAMLGGYLVAMPSI